jgi:hypothetical protein
MDEPERPPERDFGLHSRIVLPLLYGSPVLSAAVSVAVWTAAEAGWLPLYGRGWFVPYLNGFLAGAGAASAAVVSEGHAAARAVMGVVYFAFGVLAYLAASVIFVIASAILILR